MSPISVLLCDDDPLFRESTAMLLEKMGFVCHAVPDVAAAKRALSKCKRSADVVIVDLVLGEGATGSDLVEALAAPGNPPVIILTGHPSIDSAISAIDCSVSAYLVKPFKIDELIRRIELAVDSARRERMSCDCGEHDDKVVEIPGLEVDVMHWLTPREAEIVAELHHGYRVSSIANHLKISTNTVRRHLKSIFLKMEVRSQAELLEKMKPRLPRADRRDVTPSIGVRTPRH